ncbi:vacuolar-processing enzyme-like [Mangifera indica]|uniref:vacuolar-processing enzyme-like n=1 Tax=Mangifera indica TaxID=29780 RepID=UPI001CF9B515|nr:vacuolar-processing enzyme-like [Mangifera indica]
MNIVLVWAMCSVFLGWKTVRNTICRWKPWRNNFEWTQTFSSLPPKIQVLDQRDADLNYLQHKFNKAPKGSNEKIEAQKRFNEKIFQRQRENLNIQQISTILFGPKNGQNMMQYV